MGMINCDPQKCPSACWGIRAPIDYPFIYATKFEPVKRKLRQLILCQDGSPDDGFETRTISRTAASRAIHTIEEHNV